MGAIVKAVAFREQGNVAMAVSWPFMWFWWGKVNPQCAVKRLLQYYGPYGIYGT
jgi:hypothetical protein